jgi:host factor-I protein
VLVLVEIALLSPYRYVANTLVPLPGWRFRLPVAVGIVARPLLVSDRDTLGWDVFTCRGGPMELKPTQNIQDSFLNTARKEKCVVTVYLISGVKLTGRIRSFDKYSVVMETNNQEQLIFKHAISTVVMGRSFHSERHFEHRGAAEPAAAATESPSADSED